MKTPNMKPVLEWIKCTEQLPPYGTVVNTKIDDKDGVRNEQDLALKGKLWWHPDGSMYVYYAPTHWKYKSYKKQQP